MAPIKIDDHIREQLQERKIQPSKHAWKNLQTQLNKTPKNKHSIKWYAIAASVVGIISVASVLFSDISQTGISTEIVDANSNQEEVIPVPAKNNTQIKTFEIKEEPSVRKTQIVQGNNSIKVDDSSEIIPKEKPKSNIKKETKIALQSKDFSLDKKNINANKKEDLLLSETEITSTKGNTENSFEDAKIAEVVSQVNKLRSTNNFVSADEIEALMVKAQQEITAKKLRTNNNKKIDAMALLNLVEEELETSFRDKVFEKLGESFQKARAAVVNLDN